MPVTKPNYKYSNFN